METRSTHLLVELWDANRAKLNSVTETREILQEAARQARVTLLHSAFHRFSPVGVSGVVVIAESHITIHTWPEAGYAAADIFTCGDRAMPDIAAQHLAQAFEARRVEITRLTRGIPRNEKSRPTPRYSEQMNVFVA
jgi:S-adenosylmethionine decarboxylase proenzyme